MFKTPILFAFYIREDTTIKVFEKIAEIKPAKLYLSSDGARRQKDQIIVNRLREKVLSMIDWPCIVNKKFNDSNQGCGIAISSSITWFFKNENQGIILEDDCLPNISFFNYCEDLLNRYKSNKTIWHISGANLFPSSIEDFSYDYSVYPGIWGWATWADRWENYNFNLIKLNIKEYKYFSKRTISISYFKKIFDSLDKKKIDTWDFQWMFTLWKNNALAITPKYNLVSNIGFGKNSSNTYYINDLRANIDTKEIYIINHPSGINLSPSDKKIKKIYFSFNYVKTIKQKIYDWFPSFKN